MENHYPGACWHHASECRWRQCREQKQHTPVCNTPLHDKIAMATPCQYVRKTTALTHRNLDTGLMGASSYLVPW